MSHTISIRTISIFAAIIGIIAIALMAAYGNPAQGQSLPSVEFRASSYTVIEPKGGPSRIYVNLTVELSQTPNQTVTVQYRTVDQKARATQDYIAASGTLTFYPGTIERTISVTVLNDTRPEDRERFYVQLTSPTNAVLGSNNNVVVTIADLDTSAPYNLSAPETVQEGQGSFAVVVETADTPIVEYQHSVTVAARSDTAQPGSEYVAFSTVLEFDVDHNRRTFEVTLIDDGVDEPDKSFRIKMVTLVGDQDRAPYGITEVTVTILDDDPATPTNLEIIENRTDPDLDHVAILQWDYSDAEGYLLESRDGTSGDWNCIVAGTYSSREPTGTATVSTTRGGVMAASSNWHFQVRNFNSEEFSYPGEATCDEDADYGYIFSTVADQGYNLSPADTLGPVAIPAIDPTVAPTWQPTGLTIAAGAKHRDVQISWDEPPAGSNVTGFALYRKWNGHDDAPHLCLYWSTKPSEFITSYRDTHIAAYDDAGNKNKYVYTVYPLNDCRPTGPVRSRGLRRLPARHMQALGVGHRHPQPSAPTSSRTPTGTSNT